MFKNLSVLEHKIGERIFQFCLDPNSPISEAKEALCQFVKFIGQVEDNILQKQKQQQEELDKQQQQQQEKNSSQPETQEKVESIEQQA